MTTYLFLDFTHNRATERVACTASCAWLLNVANNAKEILIKLRKRNLYMVHSLPIRSTKNVANNSSRRHDA